MLKPAVRSIIPQSAVRIIGTRRLSTPGRLDRAWRLNGRRLRAAGAALPPGIPWDAEVHFGRPATEILGLVAQAGYDLIVMGSRGLSGVRRLLFGSTAEEVIRAAALPVMVVKPASEVVSPAREAVGVTADAPA